MSITPSTKFQISANADIIKLIAGKRKVTVPELKQILSDILSETLDTTIADLDEWIDTYVPKRTGQLREMLKKWLHGSNVTKNILRLILGTNLAYAEDVNDMRTDQVQHSGEVGYVYYPNIFGVRGRVILDDPEAIGSFWDELLEYAKRRILINLTKAKYKYMGKTLKVADMNKLVS